MSRSRPHPWASTLTGAGFIVTATVCLAALAFSTAGVVLFLQGKMAAGKETSTTALALVTTAVALLSRTRPDPQPPSPADHVDRAGGT